MPIFTEETVVTDINYKPLTNTVETAKEDRIYRDGVLISVSNQLRKAYSQSQKNEFLNEIAGAAAYAESYRW